MAQLPQRNDFLLALQQAVSVACAEGPAELKDALSYAVLNGGKRIRPSLCLAIGNVLGVSINRLVPVAVAVELIHAQSLVHDDLPCMDDDALRRGQPTVHVKYGEGTAVLVGDALLAQAFAVLTKPNPDLTGEEQARLVFELSHTYQQLVSGQTMDLMMQLEPSSSTALLEAINRLKTAALFRFCTWAAAYLARLDDLTAWANLGEQIGLLFQQCDDWHDTAWSTPEHQRQEAAKVRHAFQTLQATCGELHPRVEAVVTLLLNDVLPPLTISTLQVGR